MCWVYERNSHKARVVIFGLFSIIGHYLYLHLVKMTN